jgi:nucleoside-diphosphate-sugar epimerase
MRILLTGSSGWLGRFLAPMLRDAGHTVIGLDVAPGADTDVIGSVADRGIIDRVFGEHGIEAVIHGGALHKPDIVRYPAQAFVDVNVSGTLNLLEAARAAGHDRFVFTSTTSLMITDAIREERSREAVWLEEGSGPLAPRNIYGVTEAFGRAFLPAGAPGKRACLHRAADRAFLSRGGRHASGAVGHQYEGERIPQSAADGGGCSAGASGGAG